MDTKRRFLKEIQNTKSRKLAIKLADRYLSRENRLKKSIKIIRDSISKCRKYYPYVNVSRNIYKKMLVFKDITKFF